MYLKIFKSLRVYYVVVNNEMRNGYFLFGLFFDFDESFLFVVNLNDFFLWSCKVDLMLSRRFIRKDVV